MLKVFLVALLVVGVALYGCMQSPPSSGTPSAGYGGNPSASPGTDASAFSSVEAANSNFGQLDNVSSQVESTGDVDGSDIARAG